MIRVDLEGAISAVSERERRTGDVDGAECVFKGVYTRGNVSRRSIEECSLLLCVEIWREVVVLYCGRKKVQSRTP